MLGEWFVSERSRFWDVTCEVCQWERLLDVIGTMYQCCIDCWHTVVLRSPSCPSSVWLFVPSTPTILSFTWFCWWSAEDVKKKSLGIGAVLFVLQTRCCWFDAYNIDKWRLGRQKLIWFLSHSCRSAA